LEHSDDSKYEQSRANETEYATLQRTVMILQQNLLRMSEGQVVAARQMQHDFSLKLQHAQTNFARQLSSVQVSKDLITPLGLEQWVVDAKLLSDFPTIPIWQNQKGEVEDEWHQGIRARFWAHLLTVLPAELHRELQDGDVRGVYESLLVIDKPSAIVQQMALRAKLALVGSPAGKNGRGILPWLNDLFQVMEDLHTLKDPVTEKEVRHYIYAALETDPRYADFIRDLAKYPDMSILTMRVALVNLATIKKDLVDGDIAGLKVARVAAGSAKPPTQQLAHPPAGQDRGGKGRAEGHVLIDQERKARSAELCKHHLYGSCKFGDTCHRLHQSMEEIQVERVKRAERGQGGGRGGRGGKGSGKGGPPLPATPASPTTLTAPKEPNGGDPISNCYQFMANGTCNYGEQCRFEHMTADGRKVAKPARSKAAPLVNDDEGRLPTLGAMVMIPFDSRHPPFRGALGTIVGPVTAGRYPIQLEYVPDADDVASTQLLFNALNVGMVPEQDFIVIPAFERDGLKVSRKNYGSGGLEQKRVFRANAVFDTGANIFVTSCKGILFDVIELKEPHVIRAMRDTPITYTHAGYVYFTLGCHTRKVMAYYDPKEATTIIPEGIWDDGVYDFAGKGRAIHWYKEEELLGSFPRDLVIGPNFIYTPSFLEYLHRRGEWHEHAIYPIPDTVFRWNSDAIVVPSAVARVCRDEKEEKEAPVVDQATVGEQCVDDFGSLGRELSMTEAQVSGIKAAGYRHPESLHSDLPSCDTPISEAYWVYPDPSSSQESKREAAIEKAVQLYHSMHHILVHRCKEHTIRTLEWLVKKTFPPEAEVRIKECEACVASKITSKSYQHTHLITPMRPGHVLSVDTIVNLPTSVSGYKHVGEISCVLTNYGALWMRKTKSMSDQLLFWLKLVLNTTGHHPALLKMDNGEYKTKLVAEYCESNGIEISVATADTMGNMPIERRHRTIDRGGRQEFDEPRRCW
jgi:hypothetical protein